MQYLNHHSNTKEIKAATATAIAKAIFHIKSPTRKDIAQNAGVTEMTVCRAVSHLEDAGFICEDTIKNDNTNRRKHKISVAENLRFIVADLTSWEYSIYLLSSNYKTLEQFHYQYNHSIDFSDNLQIFFERAKILFSQKANHFSGISVICDKTSLNTNTVNQAITQCFGSPLCLIINIADCLKCLTDSAIDSHFPAENLYYLHLGHKNFAYFITNEYTIKSNPQILIDNSGNSLDEHIKSCISPEQLYGIIINIVNAASAMLDAKLYLIESDRFVLGSNIGFNIAEKLKLNFSDKRRLFISDTKPQFYIKGAAIALQVKIIKHILAK